MERPTDDAGRERRPAADGASPSRLDIFWVALRLGLTSFGGPIAHLGYFHHEYVTRRRWVDEETYADLVALSQSFPGAASSKLGISIGMVKGGLWGGFLAWVGFTLPSAVLMTALGLSAARLNEDAEGWIHGLVVVAVAVVALAVWQLWLRLAPDRSRSTILVAATIAMLVFSTDTRATIVAVIIGGAAAGWLFLRDHVDAAAREPLVDFGHRLAAGAAIAFVALLVLLPIARNAVDAQAVDTADAFYGSGALVFGGGHVVLPLLESEVLETGWVDEQTFIAGFGAAQAVPGPVFTFSSYLGAAMGPEPNGIPGSLLALAAVFLPSFLIVVATMPSFGALRANGTVRAVLRGVNASVVGILLATLYDPLWTSAIEQTSDFALALGAFGALAIWRLPPWLVVVLTATGAGLISTL
jgi:chromate transporter